MMCGMRRAGWALVGLLAVSTLSAGDSKEAKAALKKITAATKGVQALVADVEYSETVEKRSTVASGKIYAHFAGFFRVELGGDEPRTILFSYPLLHIHRQAAQVVEIYDVTLNPDRLGQYLALGFVPNGNALRVLYNVQWVENSILDGRPMLGFVLTPESEFTARAIARIELWVDPQSGLPVQHKITHALGAVHLSARYTNMVRDDGLPAALFQPDWPAGTVIIRK